MAGGARVNLNVPPRLIESARAAQYANREGLGARELEAKIRATAQQRVAAQQKTRGLDREGGQLEFLSGRQYRIKTTRKRISGPVLLVLIETITPSDVAIPLAAGFTLRLGRSPNQLTEAGPLLQFARQITEWPISYRPDLARTWSVYAFLPSGFGTFQDFLSSTPFGNAFAKSNFLEKFVNSAGDLSSQQKSLAQRLVQQAVVVDTVLDIDEYPLIMHVDGKLSQDAKNGLFYTGRGLVGEGGDYYIDANLSLSIEVVTGTEDSPLYSGGHLSLTVPPYQSVYDDITRKEPYYELWGWQRTSLFDTGLLTPTLPLYFGTNKSVSGYNYWYYAQ